MTEILISILAFGLVLCVFRLIRGPSLGDRLLALDLILIVVMSIFCVLFVGTSSSFYLELTMLVALAGFVSTLAFCRAIMGKLG